MKTKKLKTNRKNRPFFDLTEAYKERVIPKVEELIAICEEIKLPHLFSFVVANNEEGYSTGIIASSQGKDCFPVTKMMVVGNMLDRDSKCNVVPVTVDPSDPMAMIAAMALAATAKK